MFCCMQSYYNMKLERTAKGTVLEKYSVCHNLRIWRDKNNGLFIVNHQCFKMICWILSTLRVHMPNGLCFNKYGFTTHISGYSMVKQTIAVNKLSNLFMIPSMSWRNLITQLRSFTVTILLLYAFHECDRSTCKLQACNYIQGSV